MKMTNKIRDWIFIALTSIYISSCSVSTKQVTNLGSIDTLQELLGDTFSYEIKNGEANLNYCPDNTCLSFSGKSELINKISDFSFLYLYHLSSYVYLSRDMHGNGIFVDKARVRIQQLERKYAGSCPVEFEKRITCLMWSFIKKNNFNVRSIRLDEREKVSSLLDMRKEITEENINKIRGSR